MKPYFLSGSDEKAVTSQLEHNGHLETAQGPSTVSFDSFLATIAQFLEHKTSITGSRIDANYDFIAAGLLDSVATIELLFFIQDTFTPHFLDGDIAIAELNTPAKLYRRYIDKQT